MSKEKYSIRFTVTSHSWKPGTLPRDYATVVMVDVPADSIEEAEQRFTEALQDLINKKYPPE